MKWKKELLRKVIKCKKLFLVNDPLNQFERFHRKMSLLISDTVANEAISLLVLIAVINI